MSTSLTAKMDEWSKLLEPNPENYSPPDESMMGSLDATDRKKLAAYWLSDGMHARLIDFPQSQQELKYYRWTRSATFRNFFNWKFAKFERWRYEAGSY